ncbi:MarR family winged helix-turn-helix transcriptional regulator [Nocardia sp. NRRL S-836]|uniref:MarR family winged helix-turn-helix transcriptional regulator n=1 Tax=Nocardia sp. NRRL S-836 TaxID=1519492 RepID=UPI0006AF4AB3|nr:MarR family transcriptional regulator [Nocardia sp. NRRL S-836]KOV83256.1 MarR family transcriptional regulator [Nocardia sp. NRRL S-836]
MTGRRRDLAAMIAPLQRALIAAEQPVLRAHGLSMWGYVVLSALDGQPVRTQTALAEFIGADKSRIIGVLDELENAGLLDRTRDPADRRARFVAMTDEGRRKHRAVQADIQRNEERVLARLDPADREAFLRALATLSALPPTDITG